MKNVMIGMTLVAVLLAVSPAMINAALIDLGANNNVTPSAATVVASNITTFLLGTAGPVAVVNDNAVADPYDWAKLYLFDERVAPELAYTLDLTWATAQNINSLQAYVIPKELGLCSTSSVEFFVDQGSGLTSVGSVVTPTTASIDVFSLAKLDGSWSNVTAVQYKFTPDDTSGYGAGGIGFGPAVAEVLAIRSVPEPSTIVLLITGLFGLLAYAWRKRR